MYVSCELSGNNETNSQETDVHWRADSGNGRFETTFETEGIRNQLTKLFDYFFVYDICSFNYRLVFDVELPMKNPRLTFQVPEPFFML
jgi:hypothetical protein